MKILLTSGIFPPDIGGPATFIPELANKLIENRSQVTVVALRPTHNVIEDFKFRTRLIHRSKPRVLRIIKTIVAIFNELTKTEVLFSNGLYLESALPIRILRKRAIAKVVGDPLWERDRNLGRTSKSLKEYQSERKDFRNFLIRKLIVFALNSYEIVICPSEELTDVVKNWGVKSSVKFIPNGVSIPKVDKVPKEYDLIYVGRLVKWKNVSRLIMCARELNLRLCIVGDGPERTNLERLASDIESACQFTGEMDKASLFRLLKKSRIFVLISQYEGLSYSLLEAMAIGLPVVVSDAIGNVNVVKDGVNGMVIPLEFPAQLNVCIKKLITNPELQRVLGNQALETVKRDYLAENQLSKIIVIVQGIA